MYKEELCAGFWVKSFKLKDDQDKSSLYLKRASSLVLTNSWPQEAREIIARVGGHAGPWPLGAAFPPLLPCWKAGWLAMFSRESEVCIFMHNLLISILATNSPPPQKKKQWEWNLHNNVLESSFSLCRFLFLCGGDREEFNSSWLIYRDWMHTDHVCFLSIYKESSLGT